MTLARDDDDRRAGSVHRFRNANAPTPASNIDPANIAGSPNATSNTFDSHVAPSASRLNPLTRRHVAVPTAAVAAASTTRRFVRTPLTTRCSTARFTTIGFISLIVQKNSDARAPSARSVARLASRSARVVAPAANASASRLAASTRARASRASEVNGEDVETSLASRPCVHRRARVADDAEASF